MLKILQDKLQQYVSQETPDVQSGFQRGRGARDQIFNIHWIMEKEGSSKQTSTAASWTMLKPLTVWITTNCGKFLKSWNYQITLHVSQENCMQDKRQQLELDMEQLTGSKLGKEYYKAVYCQPAYLTSMQSKSGKTLGLVNYKLESRFWEKYQQLQICRWSHSNGRNWERTKRLLMRGKCRVKKLA